MRRLLTALLLLSVLTASAEVLRDRQGRVVPYAGKFSARSIELPVYRAPKREFRGVWVATVDNLDFPRHATAEAFRADAVRMLDNLRSFGFNAVLFQVRPGCDAFYPSRINPYSRYLAGAEGRGIPNFDPLAFLIAEAHRRGLEFHAWLNPYRVAAHTPLRKADYLATLHRSNFARRNPQLVLEGREGRKYTLTLDPGSPEVVRHVAATVAELLERYPLDGIHFDDYFYPYSGIGDADAATFKRYNVRRLTLAQWRRENVTGVIRAVRRVVDRCNAGRQRKAAFGVSPFGIWANSSSIAAGSLTGGKQSYFVQYADTRGWVKEGLLDYVVPQLYWDFAHPAAAYAALADWWSATCRGTRTRLYIGLGFYRTGSSGWSAAEIPNQLRYNQLRREISGAVFFSYRHVFTPDNWSKKESARRVRQLWQLR